MENNLENCPLCGTELSQTKFREIRAKLRQQEDARANEAAELRLRIANKLEEEYKAQLQLQQRTLERRIRNEAEAATKKAVAEAERLAAKLKGSEAREAELRNEMQAEIEKQKRLAETKAKLEAKREMDEELKKVASERDLANKRLQRANEREAEIRAQMQSQAEKERQKEVLELRNALDRDKTTSLAKQQAEFNRSRDLMQKKLSAMEQQLQRKTANELGDGAEIDVFEALREAFQGDRITRIPKGQLGADILHEVLYKGECCGRVLTDSKNRQGWKSEFVSKLRQDKVEADAEYAILATSVFPTGKKELCHESGIIVVSPGRVVAITELLRRTMITMRIKGLSLKERSTKLTQLYNLITSDSYSKKFAEVAKLAEDILDVDVQEQRDHTNVWTKRGKLTTRMKNVLREVETDVAAIIESESSELPPPTNGKAKVGTQLFTF